MICGEIILLYKILLMWRLYVNFYLICQNNNYIFAAKKMDWTALYVTGKHTALIMGNGIVRPITNVFINQNLM